MLKIYLYLLTGLCLFGPINFIQGQKESCRTTRTTAGDSAITCSGFKTIPTTIPYSLGSRSSIRILFMNLGGNYLETVTKGQLLSANLPNLSILVLQRCHIRKVEVGAFTSATLKELNLSDNNIEIIDLSIFIQMPNLKELFIRNNPIKRFENTTEFPILKLTDLDLSNCGFRSVDSNLFKNLKLLKNLWLRDNELTQLDWRTFRELPNLHTVLLYGNPWNCDCHVKFLLEYFGREHITVSFLQNTTCSSSPPNYSVSVLKRSLTGKNWNNIRLDEFICYPGLNTKQWNYDEEAQEATLVFEYSGHPKPELRWKKDEKSFEFPVEQVKSKPRFLPIDEDEQRAVISFESKVTIKPVEFKDIGKYEVIISNLAGNASEVVELKWDNKTIESKEMSTTEMGSDYVPNIQILVEDETYSVERETARFANQENLQFSSSSLSNVREESGQKGTGATWLITLQFLVIFLLIAVIAGYLFLLKQRGMSITSFINEERFARSSRMSLSEVNTSNLLEQENDCDEPEPIMLVRPQIVTVKTGYSIAV